MKRKDIFLIIIISFFIELFVFNFSFFKTMFYQEKQIDKFTYNNILYDKNENEYYIDSDKPYIEFEVNDKVQNIYVDVVTSKGRNVTLSLNYTDDLQKEFHTIKQNSSINYIVDNTIEKSKYINCHYVGKTYKMRLNINLDKKTGIKINKISVNKSEPLVINSLRYLIIFSIILFAVSLKKLDLMHIIYDENNRKQKIIYYIFIFTIILFFIFLYCNLGKLNDKYDDFYSDKYINALYNGNLSIGDYTNNIKDIYDYSIREKNNFNSIIDASYYKGKIYVYFGMLPALIIALLRRVNIYISMYLLTGILIIIDIIYECKLLKTIIYKYYPKTKFGLYLLLLLFYLFNSRLLLILLSTRFYETLVIMSQLLAVSSIYYMIKGTTKNINYKYIFVSNFLLALELFVRPNMIVIGIINLYYLYPYLKKKCNFKKLIITLIPSIILLLITFYLNYIRFDNIFEFGQHYQLTITNNNIKPFSIYAVINGFYSYFLRFPVIDTIFPFVHNSTSLIYYNTYYYNTSCGNGLIPMSILGILLLYIPYIKKNNQKKLILIFITTGLIIMTISTDFGGTVNRYAYEFIFIILIALIMVILELLNTKYKENKNIKKLLFIIVIISMILNILVLFDYINVDNFIKYNHIYTYIENMFKI